MGGNTEKNLFDWTQSNPSLFCKEIQKTLSYHTGMARYRFFLFIRSDENLPVGSSLFLDKSMPV
jgi:hypothetical protein